MKLGILGLGKMGSAILEGVLSAGLYEKKDILLGVHREEQKKELEYKGFNVSTDTSRLLREPEILLLSVKPQTLDDILKAGNTYDIPCLLSICAGISIKKLEAYFPKSLIVRAMPNTPALINMGVTTFCYNEGSSSAHASYYKKAEEILSSIGSAYPITEDLMDATLPLNGSMPAYLYYFAKCFIDEAVSSGVPEDLAKGLCADSIAASANMINKLNASIDTLIDNVCSKGGTTIAGLNKLKEGSFKEDIENCYKACKDRSIELGK